MGHGITRADSLMLVREPAWHGLGVVLDRPPASIDEALDRSGLGWQVIQEPIALHSSPGDAIDGYKANVRSDTGTVLGVVTNDYALMQIREAFGFMAELLGSEAAWETAGSIRGGKQVFIVCSLAGLSHIEVGGDMVVPFVNLFTSFDGTAATKLLTTPVRTVCANTWRRSLSSAVNQFRIRHVGDPSTRVAEARQALQLSIDYSQQFKSWGDRLATQRIAERKVMDIARELWPEQGTDRQVKSAQRRREAVMHLFLDGADASVGPANGPTVGNAPGTKWCAANAFLEHVQWSGKTRTDHGRFVRHLDDPTGEAGRAIELVEAA